MFEYHDLRKNPEDLPFDHQFVILYDENAMGTYPATYIVEDGEGYFCWGIHRLKTEGHCGWMVIPSLDQLEKEGYIEEGYVEKLGDERDKKRKPVWYM